MNEKEAISIINGFEEISGNLPEDGNKVEETLIMAKQALEKQIPKKPILSEGFMVVHHCPICNDILPISKPYCGNCGQAINWSDKE